MKATIALADDHVLMRNGLASLLREAGYTISFEASNGQQFIQLLETHPKPQVALMDINMPLMDGFATTLWLKEHQPSIRVLALSMLDDELSVVRMIRNGARGFILKDSEPEELQTAIEALMQKGYYHSEMVSSRMMQVLHNGDTVPAETPAVALTGTEQTFLQLVSTDLSYKEIAGKLNVSVRTVDGYRDALYEKLDTRSRVGLALYAVKNGIVKI
jgi:DNA-binding NarL/FixJ family response regulator